MVLAVKATYVYQLQNALRSNHTTITSPIHLFTSFSLLVARACSPTATVDVKLARSILIAKSRLLEINLSLKILHEPDLFIESKPI